MDQRILKVTRSIITKTENWSAADVFEALQQLTVLRVRAPRWAGLGWAGLGWGGGVLAGWRPGSVRAGWLEACRWCL